MKWIKTSDRLPSVNQLVLVWMGNYPDVMTWTGEWFQSGCLVQRADKHIKYWMEIEKPEN